MVWNKAALAARGVKQWYDRNFKTGFVAFGIVLAKLIPDALGYAGFWGKRVAWLWKLAASHSTIAVIVICAFFIWLDHRLVLRSRFQKHDPRTLKGRTELLREDLENFLASLGKQPPLKWVSRMSGNDFMTENAENLLWENKLHYGYMLRFNDRALQLGLEYGECGREDMPYMLATAVDRVTEDRVSDIIKQLKRMAESW
jgi:hypothetical protein